ncbi:MAG: hypothetical protein U0441_24295 [Polyangiaceae bacterium]
MAQTKSKKTKKQPASAANKKSPSNTNGTKQATKSTRKPAVSLDLVDLTPEELRALPHPREGFEQHVQALFDLYLAHPEELTIKALSLDDARNRLNAFEALKPVERSAAKHLEMVQETRALHASKVWSAMLDIYAKAQAVARTNADVRRGLADFAAFMANGPRKKKSAAKAEP